MPPLAGWTLWITGFVDKVPALDQVVRLLVNDFFIPVSICLVMLGLWLGSPDRARREHLQRTIMNAAVGIGISSLIVHLINFHHFWPRPYELLDSATQAMNTLLYASRDPTFPSNAATISFAAVTGVWLGNRKAGAVLYVLAFMWSFARFYAGIHFFVDIVSGAVIGIITSYVIFKYFMPRTEPLPTLMLKLARFLYIA